MSTLQVLCAEVASTQREPIKVMVVGGLQDLGGPHETTRWLDDTVAKMMGPSTWEHWADTWT